MAFGPFAQLCSSNQGSDPAVANKGTGGGTLVPVVGVVAAAPGTPTGHVGPHPGGVVMSDV